MQKGLNPLGPNDWKIRVLLMLRAVFGALAVCSWFYGVQVLPLPDAVTLQFTTPPFAALFAVCMVGEKWLPLDMIGAVVCLTGVVFIAHPTWLFGTEIQPVYENQASGFVKALAVIVTTIGAACAGIAYVLVLKIGDSANAIVMVLYYALLSVPLCVFGSFIMEGTCNVWGGNGQFSFTDYILMLLMGLGGYGGQWLTNLGLQIESAATVSDNEYLRRVNGIV